MTSPTRPARSRPSMATSSTSTSPGPRKASAYATARSCSRRSADTRTVSRSGRTGSAGSCSSTSTARAALPGGPVTLTQFNNLVQAGGVGVFTALWGDYDRTRAVAGAARVTEVTLVGGRVAAVAPAAGRGPIPAGTTVLLGRDAGADALAGLRPGDAGRGDLPGQAGRRPGRRRRDRWQPGAGPRRRAAGHRRRDAGTAHRGRVLRRRQEDDHVDRRRAAGGQPRGHADRARPADGVAGRARRAQPRRRRVVDAARPGARRGRR